MRKTKVLLLEGGGALGCSVQECLRLNPNYQIIAVDVSPEFAGIFRGDVNYLLSKTRPLYEKEVRDVIAKEKVDIIIPCHDLSISHLTKVSYGIPTIVDPKMVELARNKWKTFKWLKKNHFPHPETWKKIDEVKNFPVIVKPNSGWATQGTYIAKDKKELGIFYWLCQREGWIPIIQEYLNGAEFTDMALLSKDKEVLATTVTQVEKKGGISQRMITFREGPMNDEVRKIAEKLNVSGPVNIQGIRVCGEGFKVFEFNARFSMTQNVRAYSGINGPDLLIRNWLEGIKEYPEVKKDIKTFLVRNYLHFSAKEWRDLKFKRKFGRKGEINQWI